MNRGLIVQIFGLVLVLIMCSCGFAQAEEIRVGIGFAIPPYVIKELDSGLEVDIIRSAFEAVGHDVKFVYLPNLRLPVEFALGNVECIAANAAYDLAKDSGRPVYQSEDTISLQNFAITLRRLKLSIDSLKDLEYKQVLAFNNAVKYLGPAYAAVAKANPHYSELADQSLQVRMLYSSRVEVVVADKRIFLWWRDLIVKSNLSGDLDLFTPLTFHPIFPPSPRLVHLNSDSLRQQFNAGLESIRNSGVYDRIIERYANGSNTP